MRYNKWVSFILLVVAVFLLSYFYNGISGYAVFDDSSGGDFALGTFENASFNGTAIMLDGANVTGTFTSRVFNTSTLAHWNNFSWNYLGESPIFFVRSCDDDSCSGDEWNQILLDSPSDLIVTNQSYFQYMARFSNVTSALFNVSIDYDLLPLNLEINISSPAPDSVYGYNESIPINYTVGPYVPDVCWYSLDGGADVGLDACGESNFSVAENGTHSLTIYANASDGTVSETTSTFDVYPGSPTVLLVSPRDGDVSNEDLQFDYYVNNSELTGCSLLANFDGAWGASSTDDSPENGNFNSFSAGEVEDGSYNWGVECYDITAQASQTLNRSVIVDKVKPTVAISEPSGTYSSKKNIPLDLDVSDATTATCVYSLTRIGFGTILVVVMPQCQSTSFNVADYGDYSLTATVTDAGGNSDSKTSSFTVQQTSSTSGSDSGSGSGGGGGVSVDVSSLVIPKLSFVNLPKIETRPGITQVLPIEIVNSGNKFLNNCHLEGSGEYSSWVNGEGVVSLGSGEHGFFNMTLSVPRDRKAGAELLKIKAVCDGFNQEGDVGLTILPAEFIFDVVSYSREGTKLVIDYSLQELAGRDQTINVHYVLKDLNGKEVTSGDTSISVKSRENSESSFSFELLKDAFGEFNLELELGTSSDFMSVSKQVFLGSSRTTGFVISDSNQKTLTLWGAIIIVLVGMYFVWRYIKRKRDAIMPEVVPIGVV